MVLDNFRAQKIIWDRANKNIFEEIEANSGDSSGRKLVVQVIDKGVTENLSGTTLSLGWKSRKGAKGLDAFNVVDASKGIFEIYYTTEMLSNIGNIEASLILINSTGRIESSTFTISIRPSTVDDESVESKNSFTALTEALVKVNDLEGNYAPRLNEVTSQLAKTETEINSLDNRLTGIDRGYGGTFNTIAELENAIPSGDDKRYVVAENGNWYYWNGESWVSGGNFQSTGIANRSIQRGMLNFLVPSAERKSANLFDIEDATLGEFIYAGSGLPDRNESWATSSFIPVKPNAEYIITHDGNLAFYHSDQTFLQGVEREFDAKVYTNKTIKIPQNASYIRVSIHRDVIDLYDFYEVGLAFGSISKDELSSDIRSIITMFESAIYEQDQEWI